MTERMREALEKLREIQKINLLGGGQEHIDRQHKRKKLLARERIDCLIDPGTFVEFGSCVNSTGQRLDGRTTPAPCDGAVTGTGLVEGRKVAFYASDFTVLGGSLGMQHALKMIKVIDTAGKWRMPMVWLLDSSGGRLGQTDEVEIGTYDWYFHIMSKYSGIVPQITVLMGPCIAGGAYAPTLCDFLLISRDSGNLWLGGPKQTQAATGEIFGREVGSGDYHMAHSGTCDAVGDSDADTIQKARELLGYLPSNHLELVPSKKATDDPEREVSELLSIVPDDFNQTYDMHDVIKVLVDNGEYYEVKDKYAKNLITCFCRFNGEVVGLVASNPGEPGSIVEINSSDKYYRFLQVLDAYNIPLVNLIDTPPYVPGEDEEAVGLLRHFGKIIYTYSNSTIPKISIILREAYADAGSLVMGAAKNTGADICYAWPIARLAVEASTLDYRKEYGKGIEDDAYEGYLNRSREKLDIFEVGLSASAGIIDEIIEPQQTRKLIIDALKLTSKKVEELPQRAKINGTPPT